MSQSVPTSSPDVEMWLLDTLGREHDGAQVSAIKPRQDAPYRCVVIRADLQNRITPISRYCRIGVQGWSVNQSEQGVLDDARTLAAGYCAHLETTAGTGLLLHAEVEAGPYRVIDADSGIEYQYASVLAEIAL